MARLITGAACLALAAGCAAPRLLAQPATSAADEAEPTPAAETEPAEPPASAMPALRRSGAAAAQDLTLPPVIQAMPGDVRLEAPPEDRDDVLEAVVTGGQTDWRLPDLGTSLREEEEERDPNQRIVVRFAPLFDPEKEDPTIETAPVVDVLRDVGFIRIFEINIGRGADD